MPTLPKNASAEEVLRFNPFAKGPNAGPGNKAEPTPAAPPAQQAAGAVPGGTPPAGAPTNPEIDAIRQVLLQSAAPPQVAPTQSDQPQADPFSVNWTMPDDLTQALFSGDPALAGQAANGMINGVANGVLSVVKQQLHDLVSNIPQIVERAIAVRDANTSFYSDFPHLKDPNLGETVGRVAAAVARTWAAQGKPVDPMNPAFRDAVEDFIVAQGYAKRSADWKHPRVSAATMVPQNQQPYFGANGAGNKQAQAAGSRNLLDEIGL